MAACAGASCGAAREAEGRLSPARPSCQLQREEEKGSFAAALAFSRMDVAKLSPFTNI